MSILRPAVLLIADTLKIGGTEGQFVEVARGLDRARWNVDVACIRAEGPLRTKLESAGVHPWSCGRGSFKSPRLGLAIFALARHLRTRQVQIVHCFDLYSNVLGVIAARIARVPGVIASQRDLGELWPRPQQRMQTVALRLASHVLVNSKAVAQRLVGTRAARSGRIWVVPNGVDLSRFGPPAERGPRSNQAAIGALASLRPYKGIRELVEAAAQARQHAPEARFMIWGEGPLRQEIEAQIHALGLTETVRLQGPTREPQDALRRCDIFVQPSLSEASSNVVLEAMATGLPVIATRVGGTPDLVDDGRTGLLVPPGDPTALADAIVKLIQTPALAARLAAGARAHALTEFGTTRMLERINELYSRVLGLEVRPGVGITAASDT